MTAAVGWDPTLPPFSGNDPICQKCGGVGASVRFMAYGQCEHLLDVVTGWEPNERLHRTCHRCGFSWDETTMVDERNWCPSDG